MFHSYSVFLVHLIWLKPQQFVRNISPVANRKNDRIFVTDWFLFVRTDSRPLRNSSSVYVCQYHSQDHTFLRHSAMATLAYRTNQERKGHCGSVPVYLQGYYSSQTSHRGRRKQRWEFFNGTIACSHPFRGTLFTRIWQVKMVANVSNLCY